MEDFIIINIYFESQNVEIAFVVSSATAVLPCTICLVQKSW